MGSPARRAEESLQAHAADAERAAAWARQRVHEAAAGVLSGSPLVTAILDRVETLERELVVAGDRLLWLISAAGSEIPATHVVVG